MRDPVPATARALALSCALLSVLSAACAHHEASRRLHSGVGTLHYGVQGSGEPVVLVHGGFMDSRMWDDQMPAFARRFRVLRFDMRGAGRSEAPRTEYWPPDDLAAILDRERIGAAHVVGLSMGGGFAIDFALTHPTRVASLVLAEPGLDGHRWSEEVTGTMQRVADALRSEGRERAIEVLLTSPVFASAKDKPLAYRKIREQLERNFSLDRRPVRHPAVPAIERLHEISVPVLVLVSDRAGSDARSIAETIRDRVPSSRVATIPGSGHMMNLEQPAAFDEAVLRFLRAQPGNGAPRARPTETGR